jgi:hypothetical protein
MICVPIPTSLEGTLRSCDSHPSSQKSLKRSLTILTRQRFAIGRFASERAEGDKRTSKTCLTPVEMTTRSMEHPPLEHANWPGYTYCGRNPRHIECTKEPSCKADLSNNLAYQLLLNTSIQEVEGNPGYTDAGNPVRPSYIGTTLIICILPHNARGTWHNC